MDKKLKARSLKRAKDLGFNSLQDLVRVLLSSFADNRRVSFGDEVEVSIEAARRLDGLADDLDKAVKGGSAYQAESVEELMAHLEA